MSYNIIIFNIRSTTDYTLHATHGQAVTESYRTMRRPFRLLHNNRVYCHALMRRYLQLQTLQTQKNT